MRWLAAVAVLASCRAGAATRDIFDKHGLSFMHPQGWALSEGPQPPAPRFVHTDANAAKADTYRVTLARPTEPNARIEVAIGEKPTLANVPLVLDLERRVRWGEQLQIEEVAMREIADVMWLRTAYRYADVGKAVEYATVDRTNLYVVTAFAGGELGDLDELLAGSLRRGPPVGAPLLRESEPHTLPDAIAKAAASAVVVAVADIVDGRVRVTAVASGTVVGRNGSVLTTYASLFDREGRAHDVYLLARRRSDRGIELVCAGFPQRAKQLRDADLALVQCELDFDGRAYGKKLAWPIVTNAQLSSVRAGATLWSLGSADVGDALGQSGELLNIGDAYFATDIVFDGAATGGPIVDERGQLVGVGARVTQRTKPNGEVYISHQLGRVRSIGTAVDLLDVAVLGWKASERTDPAIELSEPATGGTGTRVSAHVTDIQRKAPIAGARVIALKAGILADAVDANALDAQIMTWATSDPDGAFQLDAIPPGRYTVIALAPNYEPIVKDAALIVPDPNAPVPQPDPKAPPPPPPPPPLGDIALRSR